MLGETAAEMTPRFYYGPDRFLFIRKDNYFIESQRFEWE